MVLQYLLKYAKNKKALEIGGPSRLLDFLYPHLDSLDILNHPESFSKHSQQGNISNLSPTVFLGDAVTSDILKIDRKYDLIITSHTLEHIANPIKAVQLWSNLLISNGIILNIVPNKDQCWDRKREYTTIEHLIDDYVNDTTENDMTHIHESSCMQESKPDYYEEVGYNNKFRIIHHHCFDNKSLIGLHEYNSMYNTLECYTATNDTLQLIYVGEKQ
jgi:hypothetical protein